MKVSHDAAFQNGKQVAKEIDGGYGCKHNLNLSVGVLVRSELARDGACTTYKDRTCTGVGSYSMVNFLVRKSFTQANEVQGS